MFKEEKIPGLMGLLQNNISLMEEILATLKGGTPSGDAPPPSTLSLDDPHLQMVRIAPPSGGAYCLLEAPLPPAKMEGDYWIGKYPVTVRLWREVMGPAGEAALGGDVPVANISWYEAQEFCEKLSSRFGFDGSTPELSPFRLPTEWEWEWAACGGIRQDRSVEGGTGWFSGNSGGRPHPIGEKGPNEWGLHDLLGNVWEWTSSEDGAYRVYRGGSWLSDPRLARVASRSRFEPGSRFGTLGFRLARSRG